MVHSELSTLQAQKLRLGFSPMARKFPPSIARPTGRLAAQRMKAGLDWDFTSRSGNGDSMNSPASCSSK